MKPTQIGVSCRRAFKPQLHTVLGAVHAKPPSAELKWAECAFGDAKVTSEH